MPQLYPNPVSSTAGVTVNAGGGLSGGGFVAIGGAITITDGTVTGATQTRQNYALTPAADGVTIGFTIVGLPPSTSIPYMDVFVAGLLQTQPTACTISGNVVTFATAPASGLAMSVVTAAPSDNRAQYNVTPTPDGVITSFSFPQPPQSSYVDVYKAGKLMVPGVDYNLNLTAGTWALVFTSAPSAGADIECVLDPTVFVTRNIYSMTPVPNGAVTSFTLSGGTPTSFYADVYVNGLFKAAGVDFNLNLVGGVWKVVFTSAPASGVTILAVF